MLLVWPIHLHKHEHEEFSVGSSWVLFTQIGIAKREKVMKDVPPRPVLTVFSFCFAVAQLYVFMYPLLVQFLSFSCSFRQKKIAKQESIQ